MIIYDILNFKIKNMDIVDIILGQIFGDKSK